MHACPWCRVPIGGDIKHECRSIVTVKPEPLAGEAYAKSPAMAADINAINVNTTGFDPHAGHRGANFSGYLGHDWPQFVAQIEAPEFCVLCKRHISKHFGHTQYRCRAIDALLGDASCGEDRMCQPARCEVDGVLGHLCGLPADHDGSHVATKVYKLVTAQPTPYSAMEAATSVIERAGVASFTEPYKPGQAVSMCNPTVLRIEDHKTVFFCCLAKGHAGDLCMQGVDMPPWSKPGVGYGPTGQPDAPGTRIVVDSNDTDRFAAKLKQTLDDHLAVTPKVEPGIKKASAAVLAEIAASKQPVDWTPGYDAPPAPGGTRFQARHVDHEYSDLARVLDMALDQAQAGKGKERHARDGQAFIDQLIVQFGLEAGNIAGQVFQVRKKAEEAMRLKPKAAIRELLGSINYAAAAILVLELLYPEEVK